MAIQSFRCHDNFFHLCLDKGDIIEYDAHDYDDPEDLYEDNYDDFYDYEDAEDYWEENN